MLKIGEFERRSGITIRMLRHYDEINLLKPAFKSNDNQYRLYSEEQLVRAQQINVLRDLGYSTKEMKTIFSQNDEEKIVLLLKKKIFEKRQIIEKLENQINELSYSSASNNNKLEEQFSIIHKKLPAFYYVSTRNVIHRFQDEGLLWNDVFSKIKTNSIKEIIHPLKKAITYLFDFQTSTFDVEVQTEVMKNDNISIIQFQEEMEIISLVFKGDYSQLKDLRIKMNAWMKANHYITNKESFLLYYVSPENTANRDEYISELCMPVKKEK